ncbi:hypothetical protein IBX65_04760 [Candidatus Aerophobetes bacterium]|nr:hypothetical protein [Candidatus Aerophobetes bacterium]
MIHFSIYPYGVSVYIITVILQLLKNHIETCVAETMISPDEEDKNKKIEELMKIFNRFVDYKM